MEDAIKTTLDELKVQIKRLNEESKRQKLKINELEKHNRKLEDQNNFLNKDNLKTKHSMTLLGKEFKHLETVSINTDIELSSMRVAIDKALMKLHIPS